MEQKKPILLALFIFGLSLVAVSQDQKQNDQLNGDISEQLPPLNALLDSAMKHDPYVQFRDLQLIINDCKLKANRSEWMRHIGFQTDIRYGTFDNYSTNNAGGQTPSAFATSRNETKHGYAAYIKFPLYDIVNRKNQNKLAKTEIEQAERMAEVQRNEVRQLVIRQYNDLILKQRLLKIKSKYLETSRINMEMVEKEFQNGVVSVGEYSRISEIGTRTESDFETARVDFITAYMILEEIVGFKFNLNSKINTTNESH